MEKIASFTVNHLALLPGLYVSRKDHVGDSVITTFDIRMTRPNFEPVMNTAELHTIEHLGATFLRNRFTETRLFISAPWAAVPAVIFCWPAIMNPGISSRS